MDSGLFDTLGNLKKALEGNDSVQIAQQLDGLSTAADALNAQIAKIGAVSNRLDDKKNALNQLSLDFKDRLSAVEDADLAEVMTELQSKQLAYQAALTVAAKVGNLTILNYMSS